MIFCLFVSLHVPFDLPTAIWGNLGLTSGRWLAISLSSCNTPLVGARVWYCLGFDKVVVGFFHNMCFIWRRLTLAARTQVLVTTNLMKFILHAYNNFVTHFACFLFFGASHWAQNNYGCAVLSADCLAIVCFD